MNTLSINNFKAFPSQQNFELAVDKNVLLYGENGAGKSSIYQAVKLFFYEQQLTAHLDDGTLPESEVIELRREFLDQYRHSASDPSSSFSIQVKDENGQDIDKGRYKVFLLDGEQIRYQRGQDWRLVDMLEASLFFVGQSRQEIIEFCAAHKATLETKINTYLEAFLEGDLNYSLDVGKDYCIGLENTAKNIGKKEQDIPSYYNEAKVNLVLLLTYFCVIEIYSQSIDTEVKRIIVLDDFITSLDGTNRLFITDYLMTAFSDFKLVVLTHNINFYNLFKHLIKEKFNQEQNWNLFNLYLTSTQINLQSRSNSDTAQAIRNSSATPEEIGTRIRKRFEVLIYQFAKLLMIDYVEDNKKILNRIMEGQTLYIASHRRHAAHLVDELIEIIVEDHANMSVLKGKLNSKINKYKWTEHEELKTTLRDLKLYKKVLMNPMAHGTTSITTPNSSKFINKSLMLLEKLEKQLKDLTENSVTGEV